MHINFKSLTSNQCYGIMTQAIIPRPIAWVLSDNGDESYNVAPFSFFTGISSDPPLLVLSVGKKSVDQEKDTRKNIKERKSFVVHIPSVRHIEKVNVSSATLAHGESEVDLANIELIAMDEFHLPRIADCDIALACELYRIDEIGKVPQAVIYGEIKSAYINESLILPNEKGRILLDAKKMEPLARLGGSQYNGVGGILNAIRPK